LFRKQARATDKNDDDAPDNLNSTISQDSRLACSFSFGFGFNNYALVFFCVLVLDEGRRKRGHQLSCVSPSAKEDPLLDTTKRDWAP
ncbi:unnamed protein product, partial [Linum tenue]